MSIVSMKALLESGVHFGHQTRRWNPKMRQYIFTTRNGIHIIDLQKTRMKLENAYYAMKELAAEGKKILFVGTKKQAQSAIEREADKCGMYYIAYRWPGGLLTNFDTVKKSITRLKDIEAMHEKGVFNVETKKERLELEREMKKLDKVLKGIKDMNKLPDAIFVIDPKRETIAIREAQKLRIPIYAVVDSNCDPDEIDYAIPGNDDAIRAIVLFLEVIAKAIVAGVTGQDLELEDMERERNNSDRSVKFTPREEVVVKDNSSNAGDNSNPAEVAKSNDSENTAEAPKETLETTAQSNENQASESTENVSTQNSEDTVTETKES